MLSSSERSLERLIADWDGEALVSRHDRETDTWMFIGIHSTRLGPAAGGTRLRVYPAAADAVRDVLRLAECMTLKCAVSGALLPEPPRSGLRPNAYGVTSPSTSMSAAPVFMSGPVR